MAANSSIFSTFYLIGALISLSFPIIIGSSIEDVDFMALLPFGSASGIGSFTRLPRCDGRGGSSSTPINSCRPIGRLNCDGKSYPQYLCSPPVSSSTEATLLTNDFSEGGDGGAPSECDERYHDNSELIVALSTGWYDKGSRCGKMIRIRARNGKSVVAKVVDECDSVNGCDAEHVNDPPCPNNIVNGSEAVWDALGLYGGQQTVTWSDV